MDEAIRLNSEDVFAYQTRGAAYMVMGQYQQAVQDFNEAIRVEPELALAYFNRGYSYLKLDQNDRAIEDLD